MIGVNVHCACCLKIIKPLNNVSPMKMLAHIASFFDEHANCKSAEEEEKQGDVANEGPGTGQETAIERPKTARKI